MAAGKAEHLLDQVQNKNLKLAAVRYQHSDFWIRSSLVQAEYSVSTPSGRVITDSGDVLMGSLEAETTLNNWVVNLGCSVSSSDVTPDDTMHYLSLAYQFDAITPFVLYSKRNQHFEAFDLPMGGQTGMGAGNPPPIRPGGIPIGMGPGGMPVAGGPPAPPDGDADIYSAAVGARWFVSERMALKLQLQKTRVRDEARTTDGVIAIDGSVFTVTLEGAF